MRARRPFNAILRTRLVSTVCTPHDVDDYLELVDPAWSVREVRARVADVEPEADGATSLWLVPNENWGGFRAGQFVSISVRIDGIRYTRCFSISSAPEDGLPLRITIKALPGSRVGSWAKHAARVRDLVTLSQAQGDFVLPCPVPAQLLFISGGSGITPVAAMLRHLSATGYRGQAVCLHYARHESTFGTELTALACRHPGFRFVRVLTGRNPHAAPLLQGHFSVEHLHAVGPQWTDAETFVCGPAALQAAVGQLVRERGLEQRLHVERFVSAVRVPAATSVRRCVLTFAKSSRAISGNASTSLLEQAEGAGLRPAHGCRMGVCHSCKCRKLSGVVRNQLTGLLSSEADEEIQLCVSTPCSDVTLEL